MPILAATFLESSGIPLAMVCAFLGLGFAMYLIKTIMASPAGNEKMQEIAGAVQEGAKAYLARQVRTISVIAVVIAILLAIFKDMPTTLGFVLGAVC
jgi:K(+)-stimulated pyrophosphate-energized sodium pump